VTELHRFLTSDAGAALSGLLVVAFLDFMTGVLAALRDGTFAMDAIAAFLRKHILGRVAPIALLLVVGYFGGAAGQLFMAGAIAAATAYVAETVASVWGNINPPKQGDVLSAEEAAAGAEPLEPPVNPVPTE
jgi:hypothetical protein